jgi:hypothetical protein
VARTREAVSGRTLIRRKADSVPLNDWRRHVQVERPCCSRDLVLRDGVATAHDLELRPNGRRKFCSFLADSHCVGAPSLASAAFG